MSRLGELIEERRAATRGIANPIGNRKERELCLLLDIERSRELAEEERERLEAAKRRLQEDKERSKHQERVARLGTAFEAVTKRTWSPLWLDPLPPDAFDGRRGGLMLAPTITIAGVTLGVGGTGDALRVYIRCEDCGGAEAWDRDGLGASNLVQLGALLEKREALQAPRQCPGCQRQAVLREPKEQDLRNAMVILERGIREDVYG